MKKYVLLLLVISLFSCQKEKLTIVMDQEESSFLSDGRLTRLMKSVAAHDGSFDDIIDQSPCFSINFPYQILLNGETHQITSVDDLSIIGLYDYIELIFPVTITIANYVEVEILNLGTFEKYISQCDNGLIYNEIISCVDFVYPVSISIYNNENSDFETIIFNHDKDTFIGIGLIETGTLAAINYPIRLLLIDGTLIIIESNEQLKLRILQMISVCQ